MPKAKRIAYDAKFKLEAIALAEEQGNRRTASELGINESMVRKWRRQKGELRACEKRMKAFRACKARWPELEAKLADWIQIPRADGRELTTAQIRLKAIEMAKSAGITDFTGNVSWFFRFMKRHNLAVRTKRRSLYKYWFMRNTPNSVLSIFATRFQGDPLAGFLLCVREHRPIAVIT